MPSRTSPTRAERRRTATSRAPPRWHGTEQLGQLRARRQGLPCVGKPLDHRMQLASPGRVVWISRGSGAGERTTGSSASGGAAGEAAACCGSAACCRPSSAVVVWPLTSAHCVPLRCGAAVHVDQLGVGPGEYGIALAGRACNLASDSGSGGPVRESAQSLVHLAASPLMEIEFHRELLNII